MNDPIVATRSHSQLLQSYINESYGYSSYSAPYWFVGMEQGGGNSKGEIEQRIDGWNSLGKNELDDLRSYHTGIGITRYFTAQPALQTTWNKLIRIALSIQERPDSVEAVKAYQRDELGRQNGSTCLLELLPLPSPSSSNWLYSSYTTVPGLDSRESYREQYTARRAMHIRGKIQEHKPASVVFYGVNDWYLRWWEVVAGTSFIDEEADGHSYYIAGNEHTVFAIVKHPASRGITNAYFHKVGQAVDARMIK